MSEDPHTVMHVYEGDGGVIIRDGGNISTFGVQSRAVMAAFEAASDEPGPEHHVIADLAARLAKAERERDDWREVDRALEARALDALDAELTALRTRVAVVEEALREAETVIAPFAAQAAAWDTITNGGFTFQDQLKIGGFTDLTVGHLRAALKWMESRHD